MTSKCFPPARSKCVNKNDCVDVFFFLKDCMSDATEIRLHIFFSAIASSELERHVTCVVNL